MFRGSEFGPIPVDPEVDRFGRYALEDDGIMSRLFQFGGKMAARIGTCNSPVNGDFVMTM
jgi:hypothetical protein